MTSQYCDTCHCYLDRKGEDIDVDTTTGLSTVSLWTTDAAELESVYKYYFILRPERLAPVSLEEAEVALYRNEEATLNIAVKPDTYNSLTWTSSNEEVATVDASGNVTGKSAGTAVITVNCDGYKASCVVTVSNERLITSGALTADEMAAIQTYEPEAMYTVGPFIKHAYELANIDLTSAVGTDSFFNMQAKLFDTNTGLPLDTQDATYAKMLLPGYYGGKRYSANSGEDGRTFIPADFKVGDTFIAAQDAACAVGGSRWVYVTGVYIGNGQFYIAENHSHTDGAACNRVYISDYNTDNAEKSIVWGDAAAMKLYRYYFVLRPERLASDALQSISLTGTTIEKNATTTLVVTKDPEGAAPDATVTWRSSDETVATVDANGNVTGVNVGEATITAYCDGYSVSCVVNVTARSITAGALTPEEIAAISDLQKEDVTVANPGPVMGEVYDAAGINVSDIFNKFGANDLFKKALGTHATPDANIVQAYRAETYGGATPKVTKTFVPDDFKVGDVLVANYKCSHAKWPTITAIYQGEGKFLVALNKGSGDTCTCSSVAYYDQYASDGNHNAEGYRSIWGAEKDAAKDGDGPWLQYMVFRPERLAVDAIQSITLSETELTLNYTTANSLPAANAATLSYETVPAVAAAPASVTWTTSNPDVATVVDGKITAVGAGTCTIIVKCDGYTATCDVTITRNIKARTTLTQTEKDAIAALESLTTVGKNPGFVADEIYSAVGIDISAVLSNQGITDIYNYVTDDTKPEYTKMLVSEHTGGSDLKKYPAFVPDDLKIGDLIIAYAKVHCSGCSAANTLTGVYIGNGEFLVAAKNTCETSGGCYIDAHADVESNSYSLWGEKTNFTKYFILRPERLGYREITEGALTQVEMNAIARYTTTDPGTLAQFAEEVYAEAGINLDPVTESASVSTARGALLNDSTGALIEGDTNWHKILVEGSNGGSANAESTKTFTTAEFQVGDLFCAIGKCEHSQWVATTAVYQGNGKFLVSSFKADCACHGVYVDDINDVNAETGKLTNGRVSIWATDVEALNSVWKHYFVLRPSQLAE